MNEGRGELRPTDAKGIGCAAREGNYGREGSRFDVHIRIGKSSLSENIPPKVSEFAIRRPRCQRNMTKRATYKESEKEEQKVSINVMATGIKHGVFGML